MYPISIIPHQVTEDFEVAYARAVRHYKRNLRLRWIQIVLRIFLCLVLLGVLSIVVCLLTLTSISPDPPTPRPTTQKTSTSPIITETSDQPTTTTAITEPTPATSKRTTTIQTTAMTTTSLTEVTATSLLSTSAYRPIPIPYSGKNKALKTLQSGQIRLDLFPN